MKPSNSPQFVSRPDGSVPAHGTRKHKAQSIPPIQFDPSHDRLMRRRETQRVTGLSRSSLYRLVAAGRFPAPIQLTENTVGWLAREVGEWVADRVSASRTGKTGPEQSVGAS